MAELVILSENSVYFLKTSWPKKRKCPSLKSLIPAIRRQKNSWKFRNSREGRRNNASEIGPKPFFLTFGSRLGCAPAFIQSNAMCVKKRSRKSSQWPGAYDIKKKKIQIHVQIHSPRYSHFDCRSTQLFLEP